MGGEGQDDFDLDDESQAHRCNVLNGKRDSKFATSIGYPNVTSGQSNLTTGCIAVAHGRFNGIRQVAPMCTPRNTCFLGQPKSESQMTSRLVQLFLHSSRQNIPVLYNGLPFPLKIAPSHGGIWTSSVNF